jgi:anti-sigma factor RsiW
VSGEFNLDSGEVRCADVRQRLSEYLDGDLDTATAALAITHLDTCSACTAVLEGMKNVIILLGDLAEFELPEELRHAGLDSVNRWRRIDN